MLLQPKCIRKFSYYLRQLGKKHNEAENCSRILHYSEEQNGASNSYQYNIRPVAQVVGSQCAVSHVYSEQTTAITVQLICMNHCTYLLHAAESFLRS